MKKVKVLLGDAFAALKPGIKVTKHFSCVDDAPDK
jgi:hypothetical protein